MSQVIKGHMGHGTSRICVEQGYPGMSQDVPDDQGIFGAWDLKGTCGGWRWGHTSGYPGIVCNVPGH